MTEQEAYLVQAKVILSQSVDSLNTVRLLGLNAKALSVSNQNVLINCEKKLSRILVTLQNKVYRQVKIEQAEETKV